MTEYLSWRYLAIVSLIGLILSLCAFILVFTLEFLPTNVILYEHFTMFKDW